MFPMSLGFTFGHMDLDGVYIVRCESIVIRKEDSLETRSICFVSHG